MDKTVINKQSKIRFFAQYWGQNILYRDLFKPDGSLVDLSHLDSSYVSGNYIDVLDRVIKTKSDQGYKANDFIELRSLSDITDAEAVMVATIMHKDQSIFDLVSDIFNKGSSDNRPFDLDRIETKQYDEDQDGKYYYTDVFTIGKIVSSVRIYCDGDIQVYDENGNDYSAHKEPLSTLNLLNAYDYLRSRGFALPWNGLTVEQMIEAGWIKLIDTPNQ